MSVVSFPSATDVIWVCDCGCSTFRLVSDGTAECANCAAIVTGADGSWFSEIADAPMCDDDRVPFKDVQGNNSVEFARARMSRLANDADMAAIVLVRDGGTIHAWFSAETDEQVDWTRRRLADASDLIGRKHDAG